MPQQIILRKGTAAVWTAAGSVVLAPGEPGFETDTGKFKIGNAAGQAWTALPYAVGAIPVNLADLADVTSDTPTSGQVLKWNGSAWAPAADDGGVGGAGTVTSVSGIGTVNGLSLTGTVTSSGNLELTGALDATLDELSDVVITGTPSADEVLKWDSGTAKWVNGTTTDTNTTYTLTAQGVLSGGRINLSGSDSTVDDVTIAQGNGISIAGDDITNTITISSSNTFTGTVSIPTLNVGTGITATNSINFDTSSGGFAFRPASQLTIFGSESLNRNGGLYQLFSSYQTSGYTFAQHHATADAINFTFYRTRGTASAPTAVQVGDDLADITFGGHTGTGIAAGAAISAIVDSTINATNIPTKLQFQTNNGSATAARMELSSAGTLQVNNIQALASNGNLNLLANGTGVVTLPAGSTVGGVVIGSLVIKGTVANNAALLSLTGMAVGDTYVVLSPTPTHLWSYNASSTWVDLGEFQGPTGQGVPISGTLGQVLTKNSSTNYDTSWTSLAAVANSGAYGDLSGTPTLPNSFATIAISGQSDVVADSTTDTLTLVAGSGITLTTNATTDTITIANSASATNSFTNIAVAGQSDVVADTATDTLTLVAGTGITLSTNATTDTITVTNSVTNTDTTYGIKASTTTGGATLDLDAGGSGSGTDSVTFAGGTGITVSRTDANTITVASSVTDTNTTYSINAVDGTTGKKIIRLTAGGSGSGDDDVTLVAGTNITLDRTGEEITINSSGGGGVGLSSRAAVAGTTASIANGATGNVAITGYKSYALLKMVVEHQAWVRIYTDTASRTADASRAEGVDPTPGSGVIAEVITTSAAQTVLISPGTIGFNNEGTPTTSIPIAVTNKSGTTRTITVTLTVLQLEA